MFNDMYWFYTHSTVCTMCVTLYVCIICMLCVCVCMNYEYMYLYTCVCECVFIYIISIYFSCLIECCSWSTIKDSIIRFLPYSKYYWSVTESHDSITTSTTESTRRG